MYQKILVPVDESEAAMRALAEACRLAQKTQAALCAVHIREYAPMAWGETGLTSNEAHDEVVSRVQEILRQYPIESEVVGLDNSGEKVAKIICQEAKQRHCDLIIMGTHGLTGLMHLLMGSVAEGVLRHAKMPVMLIRQTEDNEQ